MDYQNMTAPWGLDCFNCSIYPAFRNFHINAMNFSSSMRLRSKSIRTWWSKESKHAVIITCWR